MIQRAYKSYAGRKARNAVRRGLLYLNGKIHRGFCTICEKQVFFAETGPWLRDEYVCLSCRSIPRNRALLKILSDHFPLWRNLSIHESSPGGAGSLKLQRECNNLISSQFFHDVPRGHIRDGQRSENLECLTFEDESFDIVITQDVFEHVLSPDKAFSEIARTLKPDGAHVFTVPYYRGKKTVIRARPTASGEVQHLLEPDYHQNPIDSKGSLVITEWGDDICEFIYRASGLTTTIFNFHDQRFGLKAEFLDVFVSRKTP
jgi:SAM-dependent methyltransferase